MGRDHHHRPSSLPPVRSSPRLIIALQLATALLAAGYGVMFTVLDDFRDLYAISESHLGLVVAVGFFTSFVGQVTLAPLADRGHARRLMVSGLAVAVGGTVLMAVATTLPSLLTARFFMGLGTGMAVPAIRRIIVLADPGNLGRNLGRLLSLDVAGFACGPVVSALTVGTFGLAAPFLLMAGALALLVPVIAAHHIEESGDSPKERFAVDLLRIRPLAGAVVIGLAVFLMIGTFDALWALMMDDLDAPQWMANVGITVFAVPLVVLGPLGGKLAQRHGPLRVSSLGLCFAALAMCAYGALPAAWMLLAVGVVHSTFDGLTITGTGIAVGLVAPAERQAGAQGLLGGLQTLTGGVAAISAGWSYEHFGRTRTFASAAVIMVVLVAVGAALAGPSWGVRGHVGIDEATPVPVGV